MIVTPQKYLNFLNYLTVVFDGVDERIALIEPTGNDFRLVLANEPFAQQTGQPSERLQGRLMRDILSPAQYKIAQGYYSKVLETKKTEQFEYIWPNGRIVEVTCRPVEDALGETVYLVSSGREVTELRQEQARRLELEAQLSLLSAASVGTTLITVSSGIVELAFGGTDWYGHAPSALQGRNILELLRIGDVADFEGILSSLPATGRAVRRDVKITRADGQLVSASCELRRERGKDLTAPRVVVSFPV